MLQVRAPGTWPQEPTLRVFTILALHSFVQCSIDNMFTATLVRCLMEALMKLRSITTGAAAAALMFSPVAAMANTRSSEASVSLAPIAADASRIASPIGEAEDINGEIPAWLIALLLALGLTLHEIVTSRGIFD